MKKWQIYVFSSVIVVVSLIFILISMIISISNQEVSLRNQIIAKQTDNISEFDNLKKKIRQSVDVTEIQFEKLQSVFESYAQARGGGPKAALANWIQESVPTVDSKTFENLQNIIISSRDSWTMRQKELIDYKREHDNLIDKIPSRWIIGSKGKIDIIIITSSNTKNVFSIGEDNDVSLNKKIEE